MLAGRSFSRSVGSPFPSARDLSRVPDALPGEDIAAVPRYLLLDDVEAGTADQLLDFRRGVRTIEDALAHAPGVDATGDGAERPRRPRMQQRVQRERPTRLEDALEVADRPSCIGEAVHGIGDVRGVEGRVRERQRRRIRMMKFEIR